ncbi:acetyltransferase [Proteus myxofaciens]|uniref:Histone acetyltransferase n=1 Tax=Proteus myxofaciens ATCC 19692 TaxID=1354337 RepID=A0A198GQX8_9GAMM|nr:acetyltransferase [Proteus myxofaciens]OAT39473.1 histone acetyltransferase [Proteus myxofaciens ATCC 19692]
MLSIRKSYPNEADRIIEIWRSSVDATHDFLTPTDRVEIEKEVINFFSNELVWVAVDNYNYPLGFMYLHEGHVEALFVAASARGKGVGKQLILHALAHFPILTLDVNKQNNQAVGFYLHMGFAINNESEKDSQGRAYPLLHLEKNNESSLIK